MLLAHEELEMKTIPDALCPTNTSAEEPQELLVAMTMGLQWKREQCNPGECLQRSPC